MVDGDRIDFAALREEYVQGGLTEEDLAEDPFTMFGRWMRDALEAGLHEPNAMVVSTVSAEGRPSSRMVLLKDYDEQGWWFYTNLSSRKGQELAANPACSLLFGWHQLERQVRIDGRAELLPRSAVDRYFAGRPRGAQVGAWASPQSQPVEGRAELAERYAAALARFEDEEQDVPVPPHWGGYLVRPQRIEFWQGRPGRMHDRLVYEPAPGAEPTPGEGAGTGWTTLRLAP